MCIYLLATKTFTDHVIARDLRDITCCHLPIHVPSFQALCQSLSLRGELLFGSLPTECSRKFGTYSDKLLLPENENAIGWYAESDNKTLTYYPAKQPPQKPSQHLGTRGPPSSKSITEPLKAKSINNPSSPSPHQARCPPANPYQSIPNSHTSSPPHSLLNPLHLSPTVAATHSRPHNSKSPA